MLASSLTPGRWVSVLTLVVLAASGCAHTLEQGVGYTSRPSLHAHDARTVRFVSAVTAWPPARVEYHFARGWTASDLLIGFELSRTCRRPWADVVRLFERHEAAYWTEHPAASSQALTTLAERQYVWSHVAEETRILPGAVDLQLLVQSPPSYPALERRVVGRALARECRLNAAPVERLLEEGYDPAEVVRACEGKRLGDATMLEAWLKASHPQWDSRRGGMDSAQGADPALEWSDALEQELSSRPADKAAPDASRPEGPRQQTARSLSKRSL